MAAVFSQLVYLTNIYFQGFAARIVHLGRPAGLMFIILGGFVITHLLLDGRRPTAT